MTIWGTGRRRNNTGTGIGSAISQGSQWNRLSNSDEDMLARSRAKTEYGIRNEIELEIPNHQKGESAQHM